MLDRNSLSETILTAIVLCGILAVPNFADAQFNKLKDKVKKVVATTDSNQNPASDSNNSGPQDRDTEETIDDAYVYYATQIEKFDPHYYGIEQVTREAREHAVKLEAALKKAPSYRNRKMGTFLRNESIEMTAGELVDKLNRAEEIISGNKADREAQNMSYFVQGDVDDWKNRTEKLKGKDGFVSLAKREYPLLFNRAQGERELLAGYSKGNGGKALPVSVITPLHNQIDELLAEMNRLAPTYAPEKGTGAVEPFVATLVKTGVAGYIPGAALLHAVWSPEQQGWLIDKNDLGVPLNRRRMGTVLFRVPSQKFCVEQHFFYLENYAGGGGYQRGDDVQFADVRFVKCQ